MVVVIPLVSFLIGALLSKGATWYALAGWRKASTAHWTEQARLLWPVKVGILNNMMSIPGIMACLISLCFPGHPVWFILGGLSAFAGVLCGRIEIHGGYIHEVPHDLRIIYWIQNFLFRGLVWVGFATTSILMPDDFGGNTVFWIEGFIISYVVWKIYVNKLVSKLLGLNLPVPERLERIVREVSAKSDIPCKKIIYMRSSGAQARALIKAKQLFFTDKLVEALTDEELATICAHELGHLSETRWQMYSRSVIWLAYLPWLLAKPIMHTVGLIGFSMLILLTKYAPQIFARLSRKLEVRADTVAKQFEVEDGIYARALLKIYQYNLSPAVSYGESHTHPHLYDRMVAANVTPDFPRPQPPLRTSVQATWLANLAWLLLGICCIRYVYSF